MANRRFISWFSLTSDLKMPQLLRDLFRGFERGLSFAKTQNPRRWRIIETEVDGFFSRFESLSLFSFQRGQTCQTTISQKIRLLLTSARFFNSKKTGFESDSFLMEVWILNLLLFWLKERKRARQKLSPWRDFTTGNNPPPSVAVTCGLNYKHLTIVINDAVLTTFAVGLNY